jgi:hypothetical protein
MRDFAESIGVDYLDFSVRVVRLVMGYVALTRFAFLATGIVDAKNSVNVSAVQPANDSLNTLQDQMVAVGTWVFVHNGLRGEVDRGNVTWTFADDGTMTIEDTDETRTVTYSLTKYCGGYGKIGGGTRHTSKSSPTGGTWAATSLATL